MTKLRVLLTALTFVVVGFFGLIAILYARGYRFDPKTLKIKPKGILVIKSNPTGAQIFIDKTFRGASDSNFSLSPGAYDIEVKKDGYLTWYKRITIAKESVTQADISLFKTVASLTPVTQSGAVSPVISPDSSKIAYADPEGLWLIETLSLPIGFNKGPKRITDGVQTGRIWEFSPSGREIMLTTPSGTFLLDTGAFTPQNQMINIASKKDATIAAWKKENEVKLTSLERNLPQEVQSILQRKASAVVFSPDENKILYTASASATLSPNLIPPIPGSSTQKENRDINIDHTYIYDIKEDRNFLIDSGGAPIDIGNWKCISCLETPKPQRRIFWLHENNLVLVEEGKITIMDYDGTNRQAIFSGGFVAPNAFPYINTSKLLILTNLGAVSSPNLYSLSIK